MSGAPYQLDLTFTDDETVEFTCELAMENGDPFPWDAHTVEYAAGHLGWRSSAIGPGIAINPDANTVTFTPAERLWRGRYPHGCRVRETASGKVIQIFDGTLTITEGNFR